MGQVGKKELTGYPSIDRPWLKYYSEEAIDAKIPACTVYQNIYNNNKNYLHNIAIEYFGNKITYSSLFQNVDEVVKAFVVMGVKKGDKVIMFTSSTPETLYAILALNRIGAVANMINPLFTKDQIVARINETKANVMIVLDQLFENVSDIMNEICIKTVVVVPVSYSMPFVLKNIVSLKLHKEISFSKTVITWKEFISIGKRSDILQDPPYEKDCPLVMVYSSGSTGASKGIVLTNDGINATISHYQNVDFSYKRGDTFLQMVPVWFSTGIVLSVLMPICIGVTAILEPVFSKETFVTDIRKYKPNMTLTATSLWLYAVKCEELKKVDLSFLAIPITGGEQILPRVEKEINDFFKSHNCKSKLLKGYGMCELGSTITADSIVANKTGAVGYPISNVVVTAFDTETDEERKYGERGEIRVQSPCRMKEYFMNPMATEKFFYKNDNSVWGCTGDIGYIDEDGFVYILGRSNDTFISKSGRKIYCFDIENIILQNSNVAQCEVVGILVEDGYSVPVAHIILEKECELKKTDIVSDIHKFCIDNLQEDCIPCGYKIRDEFPVKNNGKRDMELIKQEKEGFYIPEFGKLVAVDFE